MREIPFRESGAMITNPDRDDITDMFTDQ